MKRKIFRNEDPNRDSKIFTGALVYSVCIMVFIGTFFFIGPASDSGCGCERGDDYEIFPTVEIEIVETPVDDHLVIKHKAGDPIQWSRYIIFIYNQSDPDQYTKLSNLEGEITAGEGTILKASINPDLARIDYESGQAYGIEIYSKNTNQLLWKHNNIVCF